MAWIGGTVGAGGAVAAGARTRGNGKLRILYILSVAIALVVFLIVYSQV